MEACPYSRNSSSLCRCVRHNPEGMKVTLWPFTTHHSPFTFIAPCQSCPDAFCAAALGNFHTDPRIYVLDMGKRLERAARLRGVNTYA